MFKNSTIIFKQPLKLSERIVFLIFNEILRMILKKHNFHCFIFLLLLVVSCKSEAEKTTERNAIVDSTITAFEKKLYQKSMDSIFENEKFNGSIFIFQGNEKLYGRENGFEDFKQKSKLDSNSVFAIGSLSKQFTAVLVLLQSEAGKLNVDDKVSKYLPEFQNKTYENITIHQLLNHTSGLNDFGEALLSKPGKEFNYSNKGYRFLGELVAKISGKSYDQNASELFKKAGMNHTSTANDFKGSDFASAFVGTNKTYSEVENMPKRLSDDDISVPAGGILSTVNDLHKWNDHLYGGKLLKPESLKKFKTKYTSREHYILGNVGYGYGIMMNLSKPEAYFHTGYVKGSPSLNIYYPETRTSVIILSNIADESKGKEGFFLPHAEVKKSTDAIESTVEELRKEMIKTVKD